MDHARAHETVKLGGDHAKVSLDEELLLYSERQSSQLLALDEALSKLAEMAPRQSQSLNHVFLVG